MMETGGPFAAGEEERTLAALASRYCWDAPRAEARPAPSRVILRTMSVGTWEDLLRMEHIFGRDHLVTVLRGATAGALTPRAWHFWHYRLGLATVDDPPPPEPDREIR